MKNKFLHGAAAFALCAGFVACSEYDAGIDPMSSYELAYEAAFVKTFGQPAADQDWGFGSRETRALTRAANRWTDNHSDAWLDSLQFSLPSTYKTLTASDNTLSTGNVYYVPADFSGTINFDNFNGDVYVAAEITDFWGNPGNVNVYVLKGGAWEKGTTTGSLTIYNQGTVKLGPWDLQATNIPYIYNGGELIIGDQNNNANIADKVTIKSTTDVTIYGNPNSDQYNGIDLKCALDIHGTITVPTGNLKVQNKRTQHVCGLSVAGILDVTQGKIESSYIAADYIKFDGASIWLTEGGHIKANTIYMPNSATYIYGEKNSVGLIEVTDITMGNQNFFDKVFSDNIYFKIDGTIKFENSSDWNGEWAASTYVTDTEDGRAVAKRMNAGNATGNPACGTLWSVGDGEDPEDPEIPAAEYRIIAEDLTASESGDFDFNDVVFDIAYGNDKTYITVVAAGGTLPLTIEGIEVHGLLGVPTNTMVNTGAGPNVDPKTITLDEYKEPIDIKVEVEKETGWIELKAEQGKAPGKICVSPTFEWCPERIFIQDMYPGFAKWVGDPTFEWEDYYSEVQ